MLNPKLVFTLPHGIDLNTPYPLPLLSPIHTRAKFLQMHFLSLIWFLLPLLSPLRTRVDFPTIRFPLPLPFLLHMRVKFSSSHVGRVSFDSILAPLSISSPCMGQVPPNSIPIHLFNFFLMHKCPIGMAIPSVKL